VCVCVNAFVCVLACVHVLYTKKTPTCVCVFCVCVCVCQVS
jgi:hypothetical protein